MKKIIFYILLANTFLIINCYGSSTSTGYWLGTFTKKDLGTKNFSIWAETQLRYSLTAGEMGQLLYRFGPLLQMENYPVELGLLYGFIQNNSSKEHRYTFQLTTNHLIDIDKKISVRLRLEHRDRENVDENSNRFRALIRFQQKLNKKYNLVIWNEAFLNFKSTSWAGKITDRNRFFLGFNQFVANQKIEWGYLNQYVTNQDTHQTQHLLITYLPF